MNKEDLINKVAESATIKSAKLTKSEIRDTVDTIFACISEALASGEKFQYIGFGSFGVKERATRNGVNPRTREKIEIQGKKVAYFTPGKKLADQIK